LDGRSAPFTPPPSACINSIAPPWSWQFTSFATIHEPVIALGTSTSKSWDVVQSLSSVTLTLYVPEDKFGMFIGNTLTLLNGATAVGPVTSISNAESPPLTVTLTFAKPVEQSGLITLKSIVGSATFSTSMSSTNAWQNGSSPPLSRT